MPGSVVPNDVHPTQMASWDLFLIYVELEEVVTMAMVGTTVVLHTVTPLSAMILPTVSPPSASTRFLFDAVVDLSKVYLNDKSYGSIKFCALPVYTPMVRLPLDKTSIEEVDICYTLGWSCWRPQEWILEVGLQSLKTIHITGVHRSEQQVGLESGKTAIKLHRSTQQNKTKECDGAHYELCQSQEWCWRLMVIPVVEASGSQECVGGTYKVL
jgi:hypothetical protein